MVKKIQIAQKVAVNNHSRVQRTFSWQHSNQHENIHGGSDADKEKLKRVK